MIIETTKKYKYKLSLKTKNQIFRIPTISISLNYKFVKTKLIKQ